MECRETASEALEGDAGISSSPERVIVRRHRRAQHTRLKQRHLIMMGALARFGMLTAEQGMEATGYRMSACWRTLRELIEDGIADYGGHYPRQIRKAAGSLIKPTHVYSLTPAGVTRCVREQLVSADEPVHHRQWEGRVIYDIHLSHSLAVVDCLIACWRDVLAMPGYSVLSLVPDFVKVKVADKRIRATSDVVKDGSRIEPDAVIKIENEWTGRTAAFFVEFDRGTMGTKEIADKLRKYESYFDTQTRRHSGDVDLLLYVTLTEARIARLKHDEAIEWDKVPDVRDLIRFGVLSEIKTNFPGPSWMNMDDEMVRILGSAA